MMSNQLNPRTPEAYRLHCKAQRVSEQALMMFADAPGWTDDFTRNEIERLVKEMAAIIGCRLERVAEDEKEAA